MKQLLLTLTISLTSIYNSVAQNTDGSNLIGIYVNDDNYNPEIICDRVGNIFLELLPNNEYMLIITSFCEGEYYSLKDTGKYKLENNIIELLGEYMKYKTFIVSGKELIFGGFDGEIRFDENGKVSKFRKTTNDVKKLFKPK